MARYLCLVGYVALLVIGWFLFELQNIWPFNADEVLMLRLLFFAFASASVGALLLARPRFLPPLLAMAAFISTSVISRSVLTIAYAAGATLLIVLLALLTRLFGPPLRVR